MAGLSNAVELKVLEHVVGKTAYTMPTTYLALVTVAVTETDTAATITEATYTGYARLATAGKWAAAASGQIANSAALTFPDCTAGTSTLVGWALVSSSSGAGDVIAYGNFGSSIPVSTTQTPVNFAIGALVITAD